jgi:hypothetical protein
LLELVIVDVPGETANEDAMVLPSRCRITVLKLLLLGRGDSRVVSLALDVG